MLFRSGSGSESESESESGSGSPTVTELAIGPEEPRLFTLNGSKFLLDVRPPTSAKPGTSCADFCGRLQPYLTPIDEGALSRQQLQLRKSQRLLLADRRCEQGASESPWAPLLREGNTLFMSRHIGKTHEVLSIVPPLAPNDFYPNEQQVPPAPSTAPTDHFATALALEGIDLRGGSPFVPIVHPVRGAQLLSIVHTKRFDADSYENMALTTSVEPPFAITSIGRPLPLACRAKAPTEMLSTTDMQAGGGAEPVCYASGLQIHEGSDGKRHVLVAYGSGDDDVKLWLARWEVFNEEYLDFPPEETGAAPVAAAEAAQAAEKATREEGVEEEEEEEEETVERSRAEIGRAHV